MTAKVSFWILIGFLNESHIKRSISKIKYFCFAELGTDEESGMDWSDLEREAAEDDAERDDGFVPKKKPSHDRDRNRRDKHKSSKNHR